MSGAPRLNFGLYANNRASVFLPDFSMERLLDLAVEAEELGYHSVWVGDSLLAKPRYDPIVTLTAIAARTKNIKLATGILQPHMRNPVVVALEWATLDIISKGRTIMGVGPGAGSPELLSKECEVAGFQRKVRGKVFEECLEVLKALWTRDSVDFEGRHYRYRDVSLGYKPVQQPHPPIWIAAGHYNPVKVENYRYGHFVEANAGKHTGPFDRVARLADGWLTNHLSPGEYAERYAEISSSATQRYGRPPGAVHPAMNCWINVGRDRRTARDEARWMLESYHRMPFDDESVDRWVICGTARECTDRLEEFVAAGVRTMQFVLASRDQPEQMRRLALDVLPAFYP